MLYPKEQDRKFKLTQARRSNFIAGGRATVTFWCRRIIAARLEMFKNDESEAEEQPINPELPPPLSTYRTTQIHPWSLSLTVSNQSKDCTEAEQANKPRFPLSSWWWNRWIRVGIWLCPGYQAFIRIKQVQQHTGCAWESVPDISSSKPTGKDNGGERRTWHMSTFLV